ncbi:hypothetical protein CPB85DRAFT_800305 [Mucidula mucida]|nr:hypothetical protein CPB85DRAFT_800305 [Mucidula mucida]
MESNRLQARRYRTRMAGMFCLVFAIWLVLAPSQPLCRLAEGVLPVKVLLREDTSVRVAGYTIGTLPGLQHNGAHSHSALANIFFPPLKNSFLRRVASCSGLRCEYLIA